MSVQSQSNLPEYTCFKRDLDVFPAADHDVWQDLPTMRLKETEFGTEPTLSTTVEAFWTERAIYFRFTCEDDHVVATMTQRDDPIYDEDVVEVFLDETKQLIEYKEFELSPKNVKFDAIIRYDYDRKDIDVNTGWDVPGWKTEIYPGEAGLNWTAVWEIPFDAFKGGVPSAGDAWRMNCYRIDRGKDGLDQLMAWSPTGAQQFHVPKRFGYLRFVD